MKIFLIIYDEESTSDVLKDRIKRLGNYYKVLENTWLVATEKETSEEVYNDLAKGDMPSLCIIVVSIDPKLPNGYWGFTKKDLWEWLKNNSENKFDFYDPEFGASIAKILKQKNK